MIPSYENYLQFNVLLWFVVIGYASKLCKMPTLALSFFKKVEFFQTVPLFAIMFGSCKINLVQVSWGKVS